MREHRKKKREEKLREKKGAVNLLPKRTARRLAKMGIRIERYLNAPAVDPQAYDDLRRTLEAKTARIGWQQDASKTMQEEIRQLHALIQMQAQYLSPADQEALHKAAEQARNEPAKSRPGIPPVRDNFREFLHQRKEARIREAKE